MNFLQKVFKNYMFLVISHIVTGIIGLFSTVYIAQMLGVANFGKISFAYAFIIYFSILSNPGLDRLGIRTLAQDKNFIDEVGSFLALRLFMAVVSLLLLFMIVQFLLHSEEIRMIIYLYGISILLNVFLFEWIFQGLESMEFITLTRILSKVVYLLLILVFVKSGHQLFWIPVSFDIALFVSVIILFIIYGRKYASIRFRFDIVKLINLLKTAVPFALVFIVTQIYFNFDITLLWFLKNDEAVGIYQAAYKIIFLLLPFFHFLFFSLFPGLSSLYKSDRQKIQSLLVPLLRLQFIVTLPIAIGGMVTANQLVLLLYGEQYAESVVILQILLWTMAIFIIAYVFLYVLLACEKDKNLLLGVSSGTCINIIGNILLIPRFGAIGAALSSLIGGFVILAILFIATRRLFRMKVVIPFVKPLAASVLMGFVVHQLSFLNIIVLILIGVVSYAVFALLFKCITRNELSILLNHFLGSEGRRHG